MDLKNISGKVIFSASVTTVAELVSKAIAFKVDLRGADLWGADLRGANLQGANLRGANLRGAYLQGADLQGANLQVADLRGADLQGANLRVANLRVANLQVADLRSADLQGADLRGAYLQVANLQGADLRVAKLRGADLRGADLRGADLQGADLQDTKNADLSIAQTVLLPEGNLIGWKKCKGDIIVELLIPQKARRSSASGRKCRAEYVDVLNVYNADCGISKFDNRVVYRKGERITCDTWTDDRWTECGGGIHFFITRIEAENYN